MIDYKIPEKLEDGGFLCITDACNLRCTYCFVTQKPHYMKLETAIDIIEFAWKRRNKNYMHFQFFGGEPLLLWNQIIVPLVNYVNDKGYNIRFGITTNCTMLTEDKLIFMKNHEIDLLTSFDGPKEIQDYHRPCADGSSSFDLVMKNIPKILEYYPNSTFRATMTPDTYHTLYECIQFARSIGYNNTFNMPTEYERPTPEQVKLLEREICKYMIYYIDCYSREKLPDDFIDYINFTKELKNSYKLKYHPESLIGSVTCGLGFGTFSYNYDGTILACQQCSSYDDSNKYHVGNIYTGLDIKKLDELRNSYIGKELSGEDREMCKTCLRRSICEGGYCHSNASAITNIVTKPYARCIFDSLLLKYALIARDYLSKLKDSIYYKDVESKLVEESKNV